MSSTRLKELRIQNFRALKNLTLQIGSELTVICGKNGTSKSSILGIAAQVFSFETDYQKNEKLNHKTLLGKGYKSQFSEHFRLSPTHDKPGTVFVEVFLHDGYTNKQATGTLTLTTRKLPAVRGSKVKMQPRPVVRNNSTSDDENNSRNFTHPVIYLSLKRLFPIAEREYNPANSNYLEVNKKIFTGLTNRILASTSGELAVTTGTLDAAVAHGANYDQESVSAGEDNVGQIVLALLSFRHLKETYADYKGGLLLIDEADASLFPAAQVQLIDVLIEYAKDLDLQVILTTHSPTIVKHAHGISRRHSGRIRTIYLDNAAGQITATQDISWEEIESDLNLKPLDISDNVNQKVRIYLEDPQAEVFLRQLLKGKGILQRLRCMNVSLGCGIYIALIKSKVPEFCQSSIVCLDGDAKNLTNISLARNANLVFLPGKFSPELNLFLFLCRTPADDPIWKNRIIYTHQKFLNDAAKIIQHLGISESYFSNDSDPTPIISAASEGGGGKLRKLTKEWFECDGLKKFLTISGRNGPWQRWLKEIGPEHDSFLASLEGAIENAYRAGRSRNSGKISEAIAKKMDSDNVL